MNEDPIDRLIRNHPRLGALRPVLTTARDRLQEGWTRDGTLLLCGNGGSAADADHIAGELLKSFRRPRPVPASDSHALEPPLARQLEMGLRAIPLTGFPALLTAYSNDRSAEYAFAQLTWVLGRPGDMLLCISTSGNSANVLHAADAARARDMTVIGLTGRTGGRLAEKCDIAICVPADATEEVQELHLPVYHALCAAAEEHFFPDDSA